MAIFGGIALAAVISAPHPADRSNRLVYWMHGAEGPAKEPEEQEQKLQSATFDRSGRQRQTGRPWAPCLHVFTSQRQW
jgi:hypothetical protein